MNRKFLCVFNSRIKVPENPTDDLPFISEAAQQCKVNVRGDSRFAPALNCNAADGTSLKSEFQELLLSFDSRLPDTRFQWTHELRSLMS